jgi:hypothetical protein
MTDFRDFRGFGPILGFRDLRFWEMAELDLIFQTWDFPELGFSCSADLGVAKNGILASRTVSGWDL